MEVIARLMMILTGFIIVMLGFITFIHSGEHRILGLLILFAGVVSMFAGIPSVEDNSLRLNESFERTLAEAGNVGVNYISETFLHNQSSIPASTGSGIFNVPFSTNPRSAKYILACGRKETEIADSSKYSLETRSSLNLTGYNWEVSGKIYPTQPIEVSDTNISQAYANVLDCLGQIGAINHNTLVSSAGTNTKFYDATITTAQKFIAGLVLEDFNSATNPSVYSGMNLTTVGQMAWRPNIGSSFGASAYRVDFFTSCDLSIHFTIDGRCYSVK